MTDSEMPAPTPFSRISGVQAQALVASGAQLVDVRSPGEFGGGSLPGAVNLPVQLLPEGAAVLRLDQPVVVFCASGMRSASAMGALKRAGAVAVYDLGPKRAWTARTAAAPTTVIYALVGSLTLGLAPFTPVPHVWEKLTWLASGGAGMAPIDVFDLCLHGAPWMWLVWETQKWLRSR